MAQPLGKWMGRDKAACRGAGPEGYSAGITRWLGRDGTVMDLTRTKVCVVSRRLPCIVHTHHRDKVVRMDGTHIQGAARMVCRTTPSLKNTGYCQPSFSRTHKAFP